MTRYSDSLIHFLTKRCGWIRRIKIEHAKRSHGQIRSFLFGTIVGSHREPAGCHGDESLLTNDVIAGTIMTDNSSSSDGWTALHAG